MIVKIFTFIKAITEILLLVLVVASALIIVLSNRGFSGYRAFVLQSGSMTPTMPVNSLILTKASSHYQENDVITFYTNNSDGNRDPLPTTHRLYKIVKGNNLGYQTKGDANNTPDPFITPASSVIGKVIFHLPYVGNLSEYIHTRNGLIYVIIIPITILAYQQLINIKNEITKLLAILLLSLVIFYPKTSFAFYSDTETIPASITTSILDFTISKTTDTSADIMKVSNSANAKYQINYQPLGAGNTLCDQITVLITLDGSTVYDSGLTGLVNFTHADFNLVNNTTKKFNYQFSSPPNTSCNFNLVYTAWQYELSGPNSGFTATKNIEFAVTNNAITTIQLATPEATPSPTPTPTDISPTPTDTIIPTDTPTPTPDLTITPTATPIPIENTPTPQ